MAAMLTCVSLLSQWGHGKELVTKYLFYTDNTLLPLNEWVVEKVWCDKGDCGALSLFHTELNSILTL